MTNFNLSDKIEEWYDGEKAVDVIRKEDVAEFIKILKEEFSKPDYYKWNDIISKINSLAGDKLK
jgi:hypothetical protein